MHLVRRCEASCIEQNAKKQVFWRTESSETALLAWLHPQITSDMLEEIARSDYDEDVWDHLKAIEQQLSDAPVKGLLPWCPREVLELERWNGAEQRDELGTIIPSHRRLRHILACLLLLLSAATVPSAERLSEESFFVETSVSTLILFTESSIALGSVCIGKSLEFSMVHEIREGAAPLPVCRVLRLLALAGTGKQPFLRNIQVAWTELLGGEAQARQAYANDLDSNRWLLGLSGYTQSWKWRQTAHRTIQRTMHCPEQVTAIASLLDAAWLS